MQYHVRWSLMMFWSYLTDEMELMQGTTKGSSTTKSKKELAANSVFRSSFTNPNNEVQIIGQWNSLKQSAHQRVLASLSLWRNMLQIQYLNLFSRIPSVSSDKYNQGHQKVLVWLQVTRAVNFYLCLSKKNPSAWLQSSNMTKPNHEPLSHSGFNLFLP